MLDDLDLSNIVIGWYKLFGTSSLVNVPPGGGKDKKKESTVWKYLRQPQGSIS